MKKAHEGDTTKTKRSTTRYEIAKYWQQYHERFVIDIGEPSCFACGYWDMKWDMHSTAEECWNKAGLERAHIIATSIGGEDTPSNYLLLCPRCHVLAPMTNQRDWIIRWALTREKWLNQLLREFEEQFTALGGTNEDAALLTLTGKQELQTIYDELQMDSHPDNRGGSSSVAVLAMEVIRRNRNKLPKAA